MAVARDTTSFSSAASPHAEGDAPPAGAGLQVQIEAFSGPIDALLAQARAHNINVARVSLPDLLDQLAAAVHHPADLAAKADWVVIVASIVLLRSRLLLPPESPTRRQAQAEGERLQAQLGALQAARALSAWLEDRPQLGRDVFRRGSPDPLPPLSDEVEIDFIEFLWASIRVFEGFAEQVEPVAVYLPRPSDLHAVGDATARILRLLAGAPAGLSLTELLPRTETSPPSLIRARSGWTSTFLASLELAKQGVVTINQIAKNAAPSLWLREQDGQEVAS